MESKPDFIIRDVEPDDAGAIARVHAATWKATYRGIIPDSILDPMSEETGTPRFLARINAYLRDKPGEPYLVCVLCDKIAGFALSVPAEEAPEGFDCDLKAIYVDPQFQRRGIGSALVRETVHGLVRSGHKAMIIWAAAENPWRRFYEKIGGKLLEITKQPVFDGKPIPHVAYGWRNLPALLKQLSANASKN